MLKGFILWNKSLFAFLEEMGLERRFSQKPLDNVFLLK